jgi:1-acyl-sn-glycerol-3-phosphate acyltransferase
LKYTIFDTPVINTLFRWFSILFLKIAGWRIKGRIPDIPKFVLVGAPHTSNWDFLYGLFIIFVFKTKIYWLGKDSLFRMPFKWLFEWLGGISIDRTKSTNTVANSIKQFRQNNKFILAIAPAGTRKRVKRWKTGFYHIANGAKVPIVLGYLDYRLKTGGIGPVIFPAGEIEADMKTIRAFYDGVIGKYPEKSIAHADIQSGFKNYS